jgi:hypothetical protein
VVASNVATGASGAADVYTIGRAESEWLRDPFANNKVYREWASIKDGASEAGKASQKVLFNYSGYLETGQRKMAIINGLEYRINESLEIEGYVLKTIQPGKVIITNTRDRTNIEVPLQE